MCEMLKGVRAETATFDGVPPIQLNTAGCVEVDLVVSGRGIHRIPGQIVPCKAGDEAVLMGGGIDFSVLAEQLGTIHYELICGVGKRVPRVVK